MANRVLLVDDDRELVALLRDYLEGDGFSVDTADDGTKGLAAASSKLHDIVVLDVMMPRIDGLSVLKRIRECSGVPVIMLTARGDDDDRIAGLELGADDYVSKPCSPRELAARIRAILKRSAPQANDGDTPIVFGALKVLPSQRRVECGGVQVPLTGTEFNLVLVLARHVGGPVGKSTLSQEALGRPLARSDRTIDMHISGIRQKLGTVSDGRSRIQTVVRHGYQLISD